ncbi:MAG: outer membrane beta-barrel protein [Prevotellaceae bacterium]|jgi:hypothetical protein|nr:outer membrane beta-barrel protein [Prevotellaceae bacterium]
MKRIIASFFLCMGMLAVATAQESQPAEPKYLPEAGDFALGIDAAPFLEYVGGFFSQNGAKAPTFGLQGQGIYAKYFLESDRAIRAKLRLDIYSESYKKDIQNDEAVSANPPTPDATTIDTRKQGVTSVDLSVGYEFRRGRSRVQRFYGGELGLGLGKNSSTYEYGNPMTVANPSPSTAFSNPSSRPLEEKGGLNFTFRLGGFVGVEYFIANKLSLGGEFTLGLKASIQGQDEATVQRVEAGEVREFATRSRNANDVSSSFGVRTEAGGSIFLIFHF